MTSIPDFDEHGHLPEGVHDCTLPEIKARFGWNDHREKLVDGLVACVQNEIRPHFQQPVIVDGSFVTDKLEPGDVDIALDLQDASEEAQSAGATHFYANRVRIKQQYGIDVLVNLPEQELDFVKFFQGIRKSNIKGRNLNLGSMKGIVRII